MQELGRECEREGARGRKTENKRGGVKVQEKEIGRKNARERDRA